MAVSAAIASAQGIGVQVNNELVNFNNQEPIYTNGRVLVPLRGVFEKMGASVQWRPADRTVTAMKGATDVSLRIGERWASVDGKTLSMDVPAQIVNGSTMVPIRFVSEALGAQVDWNDSSRMVMIYSYTAGNNPPANPPTRPVNPRPPRPVRPRPDRPVVPATKKFLLTRGSVLPVTLLTGISSNRSRRGDLVRAQVKDFTTLPNAWDRNQFDLPPNTVVEGRVVYARPRRGNEPGMIEINFTRLLIPKAVKPYTINASVIALEDKYVARNANGVYVTRDSYRDKRLIYAGYGAGAGLLVGLATSQPLEKAAIGGLIGLIAGSVDQTQRRNVRDVVLPAGTRMGVRLNRDVYVTLTRWW
jgi:hypothetical protein